MTTPTDPIAPLHLWRDETPRPGWANMAIDRALLDLAAGEGVLVMRLYRWHPHCLSFGRHEPALRRYDRERIAALGLDTVRRPTGGRAVWHARELTYAVAAPEAALGGLREAYQQIHEWLAAAIQGLGAPATLAAPPERTPDPADGACFAAPVGGEVLVDGWKVVGSAQLRDGGALLQHGSMLLEDDQALVRDVSRQAETRPPAERSLSALLGRSVTWDVAADAVAGALQPNPFAPEHTSDLEERIGSRVREWAAQFQDPAWTWVR
ncbi:MAG TPA: hypothetical protein VMK53_08110 [Gemmatimonadales bacterium]|nr:hypothetical protein [Gemmatimonadales bacterium]